jgi:hypothetical protein
MQVKGNGGAVLPFAVRFIVTGATVIITQNSVGEREQSESLITFSWVLKIAVVNCLDRRDVTLTR